MKRAILFLAVLFSAISARAQVATVSGNLRDLGLNNATQGNTYVLFSLQNFNGIPRVVGTNSIVSQISPQFKPDASGNISGSIQENSAITPANTFYQVCIYFQGNRFQCNNFIINANFNLNTATPITTSALPLPPRLIGPIASIPATCTVGQVFFATDAPAGLNLYFCTATNTWTQITQGPAGPPGPVGPPGTAGNPSSPGFSLQYANSGVTGFLGASGITTPDGNNLSIKGPDPLIDVTSPAFGVRQFASGWPEGVWATCATSTTVTLNTTNGGFTFVNGDGIEIDGCGPSTSLSTPSAPTVTPETASGPTGTEWGTSIPAAMVGASTYLYRVVARDRFGGMTPAGSATTITTGQSTLGLVTYTISTISRTNDVLTVVTTANNLMNTGTPSSSSTMMRITAGSGADQMSGFYGVCARTNATTFTLCNTPVDTRAQGSSAGDTFNQTSGSVSIYSANHIKITAVSGAWEYLVCAERPGDSSYHLIGVTKNQGVTNGYVDLDFYDYGSPFMDKQVYPRNAVASGDTEDVSNAICTAGSATPQMYSGTVTAGGGTTSLTVTPATSQTTGSPSFTSVDAEPGILAAMKYANWSLSGGARQGIVLIPNTSRNTILLYPLIVPTNTSVMQAGSINTYETINMISGSIWDGQWGANGAPQFGWTSGATIQPLTAEPTFNLRGQSNYIKNLNIGNNLANGGVGITADGCSQCVLDHVNFGGGDAATDYLSMSLIPRSTSGTIQEFNMNFVSMQGGPDQVADKSWTCLMWVPPGQNGSGSGNNNATQILSKYLFLSRRGICTSTNAGSIASNGPFNPEYEYIYRQGGIMPLYTVQGTQQSNSFKFHDISQDTEGNSTFACLGSAGIGFCGTWDVSIATGSSNNPIFSGVRPNSVKLYQVNGGSGVGNYQVPNRGASFENYNQMVASPYETSGSYLAAPHSLYTFFEPVHIPTGESFFFDISQVTSVSATAAGGGSVPAGTYVYCNTPIGYDFGEGICSLPSNSVTTAGGGNQTVNLTWTNPVGSQSSNIYRCSAGAACLNDGSIVPNQFTRVALHQTGAAYSDTSASTTATNPPQATGTGSTQFNNSWALAPYHVMPAITAPSGVAGFGLLYQDSTTNLPTFNYNAAGAQTAARYTITPVSTDCTNWSGVLGLLGQVSGACSFHTITPTNGDCVTWVGTSGLQGDAGAACSAGAGGLNTDMSNLATPTHMSQSLIPNAANTVAIGTAPLPITQLFLGTVPNQAASFDTTAVTGNVNMKFPNGANSTAVLNCPATTHNFLTQILQATGACTIAQPTLADIAAGASPAGLYNFSGSTMEIPQGAGATAGAASTLIIDTTAKALHAYINTADSIVASFASAPAGSKCAQTSGTIGQLTEAAAVCGTTTPSSSDTFTNKIYKAEGTGNALSEPARAFFQAGGCNNTTAGNGFDIGTTNAPTPQCAGSTVRKGVLQYARGNVAYLNFHLPNDWDSTVSTDINLCVTTSDTTNAHVISFNVQTGFNSVTGVATDDPALNSSQALNITIGASQVSGGEICGGLTGMTMTGSNPNYNFEVALTRNNSGTDTSTDTGVAVKSAEIIYGVTKNSSNR